MTLKELAENWNKRGDILIKQNEGKTDAISMSLRYGGETFKICSEELLEHIGE
jgi:hypothetical protein